MKFRSISSRDSWNVSPIWNGTPAASSPFGQPASPPGGLHALPGGGSAHGGPAPSAAGVAAAASAAGAAPALAAAGAAGFLSGSAAPAGSTHARRKRQADPDTRARSIGVPPR